MKICHCLSREEKEKKQQHGRERYKNLSEDEKQGLVEHKTRYHKIWKNKNPSKVRTH